MKNATRYEKKIKKLLSQVGRSPTADEPAEQNLLRIMIESVFEADGTILSFAEDSGRHNALDKAIGKCLLADTVVAGRGVVLTSRLSLEMVSRCARAGIELIAAVSAPTSMAIDVAGKCNITLCAFVRETRATVFTHPGRIIGQL